MTTTGKSDRLMFLAHGRTINSVVVVYVAWLLPAGLCAIFSWPWWLGVGLLIPGASWYFWREGTRYYKAMQRLDSRATLVKRVPALRMLPFFFVVIIAWPSQFSAMLIASGLIFQDLWFCGRAREKNSS